MKLIPVYVGKVTRREDKFDKNQNPYAVFTTPFESPKNDPTTGKPKTIWLKTTIYADKATGELPKMLNYIHKGSVVGIEAAIDLEEWTSREGEKNTNLVFSYAKFHFIPKATEEVADEPIGASVTGEVVEDDPFADE